MAFTKINAAGIGTTETVTVDGLTVINDGSFGGNLTVSGVLTYEDVTNVDSVGLITARNGIVVGSGITLSKDGDIFATGITTVSGNVKVGTGITLSPDGDVFFTGVSTGDASGLTALNATQLTSGTIPDARFPATLPAVSGANLTGIEAGIQTSVPKSVSGITTVLDLSKDDFKITAAGITTIDVRGGSEGNSHTLRIHNSGIATVGFSTYFLFPSGGLPNIPTTSGTISLISFTVHRQGSVGIATQLLAGASVSFA